MAIRPVAPPFGCNEVLLEFSPELSLEDVLGELDEWSPADGDAVIEAFRPLSDATVLGAAARMHRLPAPVEFRVRSQQVVERVRQALPGSGGRFRERLPDGRNIVLAEGDILGVPVEAVVNASNRMLRLGAGVSGALARAARPTLQADLTRRAGTTGLPAGEGAWTGPHGIQGLRGIAHVNAVSGAPEDVSKAVRCALTLAEDAGVSSLAIPLLGTGTGGLDVSSGLRTLNRTLREWASSPPGRVQDVWLVLWSDAVFEKAVSEWKAGAATL